MRVYTIGHSNKSFDDLVSRLRRHGIANVVDVRSIPRSRYNPQFDAFELRDRLPLAGISYRFKGRWLGGKPDDLAVLTGGRPDYAKIRATEMYGVALQTLVERDLPHPDRSGASALMCSEQDPTGCHRRRLVGADLVRLGFDLVHVLGDGSLRTEHEIREIVGENQPNVIDMFQTRGS